MKKWYRSLTIQAIVGLSILQIISICLDSGLFSAKTALVLAVVQVPIISYLRWTTETRITSVSPKFDQLQDEILTRRRRRNGTT